MKTSANEVRCDGCGAPIDPMHGTALFLLLRGPLVRHLKADFHDWDCLRQWVQREASLRKAGV